MLMSGRLIYKLASRSRGRRALPVHHLVRTLYVAAVVSVRIQNLQVAYLTFMRALARLSSGGEGAFRFSAAC